MVSHEPTQGSAKIEGTPDHVTAAALYRAAGWVGPLPVQPGRKKWPPRGWTGHGAPYPSPADTWAWLHEPPVRLPDGRMQLDFRGTRQVALRMGSVEVDGVEWDTVGIDVDAYGAKHGAETLALAEAKWGKLPPAPRSSSRGLDDPSGIRFYRMPAGTVLAKDVRLPSGKVDKTGKPIIISDIEIVQRTHRYAVVWPSVHPEGREYRWWGRSGPLAEIPRAADLPLLPRGWIDGLRRDPQDVYGEADTEQIEEFLQEHTAGRTNLSAIKGMIETFERRAAHGSRHDALIETACMAAREARAGHYPARVAFDKLRAAFLSAMTTPRAGARRLTPQAAASEYRSAVAWAVGQVRVMSVEECREASGAHNDVIALAHKIQSTSAGTTTSIGNAAVAVDAHTAPSATAAADATAQGAGEDAGDADDTDDTDDLYDHADADSDSAVDDDARSAPRLVVVDGEGGRSGAATDGRDDLQAAFEAAARADEEALVMRAIELGSVAAAKAELSQRRREEARQRILDESSPPRPAVREGVVWGRRGLATIPRPKMAIAHLLPDGGVGFIGGPSGAYKTFLAVGLAVALATGRPALGHGEFTVHVEPKRVLYVAAEDPSGVALRIEALLQEMDIEGEGIGHYGTPLNLASERDCAELLDFLLDAQVDHVVYDTWRATTLGIDENDNSAVSQVLGRLQYWRSAHGITSTIVDHTNKAMQTLADLTGAGAKRANADYVLMLDLASADRSPTTQRTLRVAKLKNAPDGQTWPVVLDEVEVRDEHEGGLVTTTSSGILRVGEVSTLAATPFKSDRPWHDVLDDEAALPADVVAKIEASRDKHGVPARGKEVARDVYRILRWVDDRDGLTWSEIEHILKEGGRDYAKSTKAAGRGILVREGIVTELSSRRFALTEHVH